MEIMRHRGTTRGYRSIALLGVLAVLLIFPSPTVGQGKANLIGPQDVLTLSIYAGGEEQRKVDLTVSNDDMINAPFIGPVKARGLTISELETLIAELLKKDYLVPRCFMWVA